MPLNHPTRGRTSPSRLSPLDSFLLATELPLLTARTPSPFVDLGFGDRPDTTLTTARTLRAENPSLPILGLELDPRRAASAAAQSTDALTRFEPGGFDALPRDCRVIRVMNVLRGYPADAIPAIHARLGDALIPGGLALEGSADPPGAILTCHLLRKTEAAALLREALLFQTSFAHGFAPVLFRDWLPRDLRRRVKPGEWIHSLFERWTSAWALARTSDPRESFLRTAERWAQDDAAVDPRWADRGWLLYRPEGGIPR